VAVLDSGIDTDNSDIDAQSDRIMDIRSWVDGQTAVKTKRGEDVSGHGTHITGIILDLAPNVDLYIARVTKTRELPDTEQIVKVIFDTIMS
jgi:subtilisin family serine protease